MKNLKPLFILIVLFTLLGCVSKKKFESLENRMDKLAQFNSSDFSDDDKDGVFNVLDQEPDTREGCPVDTRGVILDSDGDGLADCDDDEPFSPPGYEVGSSGIAQVPAPKFLDEDDVNKILDARLNSLQGSGNENNSDNEFTLMSTYFATDRNVVGEMDHPQLEFGNDRDKVKYGKCTISIPKSHKMGEIESPSWWRLEFWEYPSRHVMYREGQIFDKEGFFQEMQSTSGKKVLLFVHGYNVSFVNAAKRTAQMAYDMRFPGIPIFYSWPSQAALKGYFVDSENIKYAEPGIKQFIIDLITQMPDHEIYIVAHSMGNRGVTKALASIFEKSPEHAKRIKEIILTAPDIDAEIFTRDIAPSLVMHGNSVTLYASSTDKALMASKTFNGHQRAGDTRENIVIVEGMETIDATNTSTGFLGHSYFGETKTVLSDIDRLIDHGEKADDRFGLKKMTLGIKEYWKFQQ